jgi:uncharacterized protein YjiK
MKSLDNFLSFLFKPTGNFFSMGGMLLVFASFLNPQCQKIKKNIEFPYNINHPDKEYVLDKNLAEVSGLSFISPTEVALIQDELGSIFIYDLNKHATTKKIPFSKKGDYEDLEIIGDTGYVLRSDGRLSEITGLKSDKATETNLKTELSGKNNTEGLCYDDRKNLLLIACKGKPAMNSKSKDLNNKKAIYSFDRATNTLSDTPYVLIDVSEVEKMSRGKYSNVIQKLLQFYTKGKADHFFEPSGIAIQPATRELYIISSVGKVMVILSPDGKLSNVVNLNPKVFKQPEGIAFDAKGDLYITNEGGHGKGNILEFNFINKVPSLTGI